MMHQIIPASLRETHTANMVDGSLNLSSVSINTTGFNYFIEISMNEGDQQKHLV